MGPVCNIDKAKNGNRDEGKRAGDGDEESYRQWAKRRVIRDSS